MGEEIDAVEFLQQDFKDYAERLQEETKHLKKLFTQNQLSSHSPKAGFELEVWLVDKDANPAPLNDSFLKTLNDSLVSPELSRFNIELNGEPENLDTKALSKLHATLENSWQHCFSVATTFDASLVMIGILPNVTSKQLVLKNMSKMKRYFALNKQVLAQRKGKPLTLDIVGHEHLKTEHQDVMLESATTSFQLHWQIPIEESVRAYNASIIASAATVAISANSPYLFDKDLWDETRIPLFEQAVEVGGFNDAAFGPIKRVSFGSSYARESLMEVFQENLDHYPILLPVKYNEKIDKLKSLRLHNGTIWRWNRPLIGFDEKTNQPHVRIEHRVIAAGPTIADGIANAAFYYGLANYLKNLDSAPELEIPFSTAKDNFYKAAKSSLNANVKWLDNYSGKMKPLLEQHLIPNAIEGLQQMNITEDDIKFYMDIITQRVKNEQHGTNWLRNYKEKHSCSMQQLTAAYAEQQNTGKPVHSWTI